MSFGRYELKINGDKRGDFLSLDDVYQEINVEYGVLQDRYSGVVRWEIEDFGQDRVRVAHHNMEGGFWDCYAEDAKAFSMWLDLCGWNSFSD